MPLPVGRVSRVRISRLKEQRSVRCVPSVVTLPSLVLQTALHVPLERSLLLPVRLSVLRVDRAASHHRLEHTYVRDATLEHINQRQDRQLVSCVREQEQV